MKRCGVSYSVESLVEDRVVIVCRSGNEIWLLISVRNRRKNYI